jgi:hypothetical protein
MEDVQKLHNFTLLNHFTHMLVRIVVCKLAVIIYVLKKTTVKLK